MGPSASLGVRVAAAWRMVSTSSGIPWPVIAETRQKGAFCKERSGNLLADLLLDDVDPVLLGQIALGQNHDASSDVQQLQDLQVLMGLRHNPFHDIDHQQNQVDAADAGQHVADEALVTGNIDDPGDHSSREAKGAKPRSMEMPRAFSSLRRSVSAPVRALISAVLPWSTWPAVPMMMCRLVSEVIRLRSFRGRWQEAREEAVPPPGSGYGD